MSRRGNIFTSILFIVIVLVALLGGITKLMVGNHQRKAPAASNLEIQTKIQNFLIALAKNKIAYQKTLEQDPKLIRCANACTLTDHTCWLENDFCPVPPKGFGAAAAQHIPVSELRDERDRPISRPDGSVYLTSNLQPCSVTPSKDVIRADENCQWRVEMRPYANEHAQIVFRYRLLHNSPIDHSLVHLADLDFEVNTEQPRVFSFKRFTASARVDSGHEIVTSFVTDGKAQIEALVRCNNNRSKKNAVLNIYASDCSSQLFGPESFGSLDGNSTGHLETLGAQKCSVHVKINESTAGCTLEMTAKSGQFSSAGLEASAGGARMENPSLIVSDPTRGEDVVCRYKNGGKLSPPTKGVAVAEINLCNCPQLACFEKAGTMSVADGPPFEVEKESRITVNSELWIELRNADGGLGSAQISIARP
jgi:hypothetical protein